MGFSRQKSGLLVLLALLILHQNYWMWSDTRLVLGLPINLLYHLGLCFLMPPVMYWIMRRSSPARYDD